MKKAYGPPQTKLKYGEEPRIIASVFTRYGKGGTPEHVTYLCPNYPEIYARDVARGYRPMLDLSGSDDLN